MNPRLSLILCSRNDQYMGNSLWRLETTLNFVAEQVVAAGRQGQVELLVADWGSEVPLAAAVTLGPAARAMTSFLLIPPALASERQGDSPFPEVLALNAVARRVRGEYIGRIDQDTLVGERFFRVFFEILEGRRASSFPVETTLLFSCRRRIPYRFAVRCPRLSEVALFVKWTGRRLKVERGPYWAPFYVSSVGIWLVHRRLWEECGGYDEAMIYMGAMESNMIARLMKKYAMADLGTVVNYDFYHLEHHHPWALRACWANRRANDEGHRMAAGLKEMNPNGDGWGLADCALTFQTAGHASHHCNEDAAAPLGSWPLKAAARFSGTWLLIGLESLGVGARNVPRRLGAIINVWRHRLSVARATVRGRPITAWPKALQDRWINRDRGPLVFPRNIIE